MALTAGHVADPVTRMEREFETDFRRLMQPTEEEPRVVWRDGESEVILHRELTRVKLLPDGIMLVGITLSCAETGMQELTVPFAFGSGRRLAGMLATTERKPRGHAVLVDRWGEPVVATAWGGVLKLAARYAASAGEDPAGSPLVPAAVVVDPPRLSVVPRARFAHEHRQRGAEP
jgi:hypothetical protein